MFDIPIVIFLFKRDTGLKKIFERIREIKPKIIYIIADGPRNEIELAQTEHCRKMAEALIDWECNVIKNYADKNRGVYANIGEGAKWVLEREKWAIFIEDDNLPDISFFSYCRDLLNKYEDNEQILWICGTNYLENFKCVDSYMFTQHLLPCGWASWSHKFLNYYDGTLDTLSDEKKISTFKQSYQNKLLYKQQLRSVERTKYLMDNDIQKSSWDYQMIYALRANNLYGISPRVNLIENIGVDQFSEHGGGSKKNRFCGMRALSLPNPLIHPDKIKINDDYEKRIGNIILYPRKIRIIQKFTRVIKKVIGMSEYASLQEYLKEKHK